MKRRRREKMRQELSHEAIFPPNIVIRARTAAEEAVESENKRRRERIGRIEGKVGHNSLRRTVEGSCTKSPLRGRNKDQQRQRVDGS